MDDENDNLPSKDMVHPQLYDFLKHLSTLSLISIGGILGLVRDELIEIPSSAILMSLGAIAIAAFLSLVVNSTMIGSITVGDSPPLPKHLKRAAAFGMMFYAMGVGIFTGAFAGAIIDI